MSRQGMEQAQSRAAAVAAISAVSERAVTYRVSVQAFDRVRLEAPAPRAR